MDPNDQNPMGPAGDQGVPTSDQGGQPDIGPTPPAPGPQEPPEEETGEIAPPPPVEEPPQVPTDDSQESSGGQPSQ